MIWLIRERLSDEKHTDGVIITPDEVESIIKLLRYSTLPTHKDIVFKLDSLLRQELPIEAQRWADDGGQTRCIEKD